MSLNPAVEHLGDQIRPLSRAEYDKLVAEGAFEGQRCELLYGVIVEMSPREAPHAYAVQELAQLLMPIAIAGRAKVRVQLPYAADDYSEPEPDIAIVPLGRYDDDHPATAHLVIEVADSSARKDRVVKSPLYAAGGIPEYWLVDVARGLVEVYDQPGASGYARRRVVERGQSLSPGAFPDVTIPVDAILPG